MSDQIGEIITHIDDDSENNYAETEYKTIGDIFPQYGDIFNGSCGISRKIRIVKDFSAGIKRQGESIALYFVEKCFTINL